REGGLDRVGGGEVAPVLGARAAPRRVEGREQRVLDEHARAGDGVEQARLARVRVAGDRDGRDRVPLARRALGLAPRGHRLDLAAQLRHAVADAPTVQLDLRLTRTARAHARAGAADLTTGLPGHRLAPPAQAREEVLELGELDLGLALPGLRVLGEDVEDERGPVDDLDLDDVLERTALGRCELAVDHDGVRAAGRDDVGELGGLARAEVGARVRLRAALDDAVEHLGPGRLGERRELAQRDLGLLGRRGRAVLARVGAGAPDPDEHDPLEAQLPVLDPGDALALARPPGDAAQRAALREVELLAVVLRVDRAALGTRRAGPREHPCHDVARDVPRRAGRLVLSRGGVR